MNWVTVSTDRRPSKFQAELPPLRPSQLKLYQLLEHSQKFSEPVTKEKVFDVYKNGIGCGESDAGGYSDFKGVWHQHTRKKWDDWQWQRNAMSWFKQTLGALIIKGYCSVLPRFDFCDVDPQCVRPKQSTGEPKGKPEKEQTWAVTDGEQ